MTHTPTPPKATPTNAMTLADLRQLIAILPKQFYMITEGEPKHNAEQMGDLTFLKCGREPGQSLVRLLSHHKVANVTPERKYFTECSCKGFKYSTKTTSNPICIHLRILRGSKHALKAFNPEMACTAFNSLMLAAGREAEVFDLGDMPTKVPQLTVSTLTSMDVQALFTEEKGSWKAGKLRGMFYEHEFGTYRCAVYLTIPGEMKFPLNPLLTA